MNFQKQNKFLSHLLISLFVLPLFFIPNSAAAQTSSNAQLTDSQIASKASTDCISLQTVHWAATKAASVTYSAVFGVGNLTNKVTAVPTSDALTGATTASAASEAGASNWWQSAGKPFFDCVAYKTGQYLLDNFTNQTVNWIKGGMNGSPHYAVDPQQMEKDLLNSVAGNFIREIDGIAMCDFDTLFKNDLKRWVVLGQSDPALRFQQAVRCPFNSINASDFYRGVQKFSWEYFETALNDRGNPFGVAVVTSNELTALQKVQKDFSERMLNWDSGFLSVVDTSDCPTMPADVKAIIASGTDWDGNPLPDGQVQALQRQYCKKVTPGKLIESQLSKSTGVAFDRLCLADNLTKIVSALVTKLSNDAIQGVFKK